MSVSGVGLGSTTTNLAPAQGPVQNLPQVQSAQISDLSSSSSPPSALNDLLSGFSDKIQSAEANETSDSRLVHEDNELLSDNSSALIDNSASLGVENQPLPGTAAPNGNEVLAKAFDRSINMAAATLVVSGVTDTMRQLIRQQ